MAFTSPGPAACAEIDHHSVQVVSGRNCNCDAFVMQVETVAAGVASEAKSLLRGILNKLGVVAGKEGVQTYEKPQQTNLSDQLWRTCGKAAIPNGRR
jgi:hypothetical protein